MRRGDAHEGDRFKAICGDCVDVLSQFPDDSIGFSVYSPPFGSLFVYSEGAADMGNSTDDEFAEKMKAMTRARALLRVRKHKTPS